ncbi:FAD-dependent oxidoreductase [Paracoccus tegillarcae]|uniref:FAD-dependent oxidoreductase n=1 Tax=Paracoccus tegillarcae TaxID=1529068 RepID=UPI001E473603|nr:NAD(P)-binding protein [Paracoccus tegillarcae]
MKLRIAITGAGIGGLSAALLAHAESHDVTLFEQFDRPGPVGSGLVIQPVGLAVLDLIGAGEEARALSCPILRMYGDTAKGDRTVLDVPYPTGAPGRAFQRAGLFDLLWRRVTAVGIPTVTSARVTAAPLDRDRRLIRLADGRAFGPFDLVVDAAGAGSHLSPIQTRPLSYGAIWGTVP